MNVVIGLVGLGLVLAYTVVSGHTHAFTGLLYGPAVVLLLLAPVFMVITSYRLEELWGCVRAVGRALRFNAHRSRSALFGDLSRFATEVRRRRPAEALAVAEGASHELIRQLAPLVVKQYAAESIRSTASTATYVLASSLRRSEEVLTSLARVAPATGLVGTVLGLITLLKDLSRFDQLGPSMALALLCTLYGLVLANAVYQPLGRLVHSYAAVKVEESKLVTRALELVAEGKPLSDVRNLFELAHGEAAEAEPVVAPDIAHG